MAHSKTLKKPDEAGDNPAGRITHDERGNAVWRAGSEDSTSTMLRKLEVPELQFEGQEERKSVPLTPKAAPANAKPATPPPDPAGGYNPYDQGKAVKKPTTPKAPVVRKRSP